VWTRTFVKIELNLPYGPRSRIFTHLGKKGGKFKVDQVQKGKNIGLREHGADVSRLGVY
jgi:hypothetical protein